ncbi:hypothetical protein KKQ11_26045 [Pseudomonas sp. MG-2]|uniref:hypothetical protein n=1 Tax=Pseudomonas sp. MG-2 TaxID=405714 RepID=UPI001C0058F5|nr:hypothetical protein [Pseudomonas sp. MG-2]MBT9239289.1 hypothetical protein [Pseudomonas sp. MG-2]
MAPRKPARAPGMATGYDVSYSCTHCETDDLDRFEDLNDRTWTCKTCDEPVLVELENSGGDKHYVRRCPARELQSGDFIYLDHDVDAGAIRVLASSKATVKGNFWHLALEGIGSERVHPDRYYNRIP